MTMTARKLFETYTQGQGPYKAVQVQFWHDDYIQPEATSSSPQQITYSQRLLVALLNIDKYNNIMNNTKEYKLIMRKDNKIIIIQDKTAVCNLLRRATSSLWLYVIC
jgi:hypothetical protein